MDAGEMAQKRTRGWHHDDASPLLCMVFPTGVEPVACPLGVQKLLVSYRISWFYMKYFFD
jgi:hypothetical protein